MPDIDAVVNASTAKPQLIFKHSTRCSISSAAKHRLDSDLVNLTQHLDVYHLDLLLHREISNEIADRFGVTHQSPQVIVVRNGQPLFDMSHYDIDVEEILLQLHA